MPQEILLVAYTNAETVGGAERCLATILAGLAPPFRITVVATDPSVGETVSAGCVAAEVEPVEPPARFWDARAVAAHRRLLQRLDPHICVVNLQTPYCALHASLAAILISKLKVVAIEHLPLPSRSRAAHWLAFLVKSCTVAQACSCATTRALWQPPAIDMWAPNSGMADSFRAGSRALRESYPTRPTPARPENG